MPLRKSTGSTASKVRICGVIWIIGRDSRTHGPTQSGRHDWVEPCETSVWPRIDPQRVGNAPHAVRSGQPGHRPPECFGNALPMLSLLPPEGELPAHSFQLTGKLFRFDFHLCCDCSRQRLADRLPKRHTQLLKQHSPSTPAKSETRRWTC